MFSTKQAGQLEDWREGERLFRGGEKTGGEGGGEQPKSRGVEKQRAFLGSVEGRELNDSIKSLKYV